MTPNTDTEEPKRTKDRSDIVDPRFIKSNTDSVDPNRAIE